MDSPEHEQLLFDAVLNELDDDGTARLEAAMRASPGLRRELTELRSMWEEFGTAIGEGDPPRLQVARSGPRRPRWRAPAAGLAAAAAFFALGSWWGQRPESGAIDSTTRFAVLLYAGSGGGATPAADDFVRRVVQEHTEWADLLKEQQRHVLSEKLSTAEGVDLVAVDGAVAGRAESDDLGGRRLGGIYVIQADDLAAATQVARGCPLLKYGGLVRVRPIEVTPQPERGSS